MLLVPQAVSSLFGEGFFASNSVLLPRLAHFKPCTQRPHHFLPNSALSLNLAVEGSTWVRGRETISGLGKVLLRSPVIFT